MFKQYKYLLLPIFVVVFVATIGVNFFKPFGFFRESNAALVCINADVWNKHKAIEQAGIPVNSYYFLAYQNTNDQLYTSTITFGSAWISLPYYFFSITHIEPNEIGIRLFSLVWLLFTLCSLILLTKAISQLYNLPRSKPNCCITLFVCTRNFVVQCTRLCTRSRSTSILFFSLVLFSTIYTTTKS
jgi:hypothetical protein